MSEEQVDLINKNTNSLANLENMIISLSNMVERQSEKIDKLEEHIENWVIINEKTYEDNKDQRLKDMSKQKYDTVMNFITALFSPIAMPLSLWMSVKVLLK
jgi:hypothetical protein